MLCCKRLCFFCLDNFCIFLIDFASEQHKESIIGDVTHFQFVNPELQPVKRFSASTIIDKDNPHRFSEIIACDRKISLLASCIPYFISEDLSSDIICLVVILNIDCGLSLRIGITQEPVEICGFSNSRIANYDDLIGNRRLCCCLIFDRKYRKVSGAAQSNS